MAQFATLADVVVAVERAPWTMTQQRDAASAVRTAARVLGVRLEDTPADPVLLGRRLAEASPIAHGTNPRRWANVRSLVAKALATVAPVTPSRSTVTLAPAWQALRQNLLATVKDERHLAELTRFMRHCTENGILPADVDQHVFDGYRVALASSLRKSPEDAYAGVCRAWNKAAEVVPGWPGFVVARETKRRTWTLQWSAFPPSLKADVDRWLDRLRCLDLTDDGPARPVKVSTAKMRDYQLRMAASALVVSGVDAGAIQGLSDLVTPAGYASIVRHLLARRDGKPTSTVAHLAMALISVARHHVGLDAVALQRMTLVVGRMGTRQKGLTAKSRAMLRQFNDQAKVQALLNLPRRLMAEAKKAKPRRAAILAQIAVAIELELMSGLRIANLVRLDLEENVIRSTDGRRVTIYYEEHAVKNGAPLEFDLPDHAVELLECYLRDHRPRLLKGPSTALFPGRGGKPKAVNTLRIQIADLVREFTGTKMHPHGFRHLIAWLFLQANPGQYEVVRRLLGHAKIETTIAYYAGTETAGAVRHFHNTIGRLRDEGQAA